MEISLIDEKLTRFPTDLPSCISYLNLHCNSIKLLDRDTLSQTCHSLKTLDISSNLLTNTDGIELLIALTSLNLACNRISVLTPTLALLTKLVLKNNKTLRELVLKRDEISNPVCISQPDYRAQLHTILTSIDIIDGVDRDGVSVSPSLSLNLMPELDELLKLHTQSIHNSSSSSIESSVNMKDIPQLDKALKLYRQNRLLGVDGLSDSMDGSSVSAGGQTDRLGDHTRLQHIEELLVHILDKEDAEGEEKNTSYEFDPFEGNQSPPVCLQRNKPQKDQVPIQIQGNKIEGSRGNEGKRGESNMLVAELESERERRWKAEEASKRLVGFIRELQSKESSLVRKQELAIAHGSRLDKVITKQATKLRESEQRIHGLSVELEELKDSCRGWKGKEVRYQDALKKIQIVYKKLKSELEDKDIEFSQEFSLHQKTLEHTQQELAIAIISNGRTKEQLQQLQALFVSQEQQNHAIAAKLIPRDGEEVRLLIQREQEKYNFQIQQLTEKYQYRIDEGNKNYKSLEDEFRMALRIEADRYTELDIKHSKVSEELLRIDSQFITVSQREHKATQLVSDLTSMVKEQKHKLQTLAQSNDNMLCEFQAKICSLQEELEEARIMADNYEKMSNEHEHLTGQLTAERSVASGLRQERELWSQELAKQGAALAHDQGRLEAQIESQRSEMTQLAKLLSEERDNLKIKVKIINDQNDSITELKSSIRALKEENLSLNNNLKDMDKIASDRNNDYQQLEAQYEDMSCQLRELSENIEASNEEKEKFKEKYSYLKSQWNEKVEVISTIENEMTQAKLKFAERETQISQEKQQMEKIISETNGYREKLEFEKKQALHEMSAEFNRKVSELRAEADEQIVKAKEKERGVEEEMRTLLFEISQERKHMQLKFQKLTSTIQDIQNDL
ncbi:Leucine-rich repeat and coiled-coil domain-containing protein 1 [Oopsacas minuta]|uniref:Leucine-rich repeat and coiled-coil domain-containing protein 1 n=1 Tax=Oopsacas minuta TaxID=111878 RepID=A0AAV7JWT8_9METZ|nr:Leucine-rich repeat and coiled-coil domain-containing protein 1 [Oopsacas minuta]